MCFFARAPVHLLTNGPKYACTHTAFLNNFPGHTHIFHFGFIIFFVVGSRAMIGDVVGLLVVNKSVRVNVCFMFRIDSNCHWPTRERDNQQREENQIKHRYYY